MSMPNHNDPAEKVKKQQELNTDTPLSEKDEVKEAEQKMAENIQHQRKEGVAADLKNRESHKDTDNHK